MSVAVLNPSRPARPKRENTEALRLPFTIILYLTFKQHSDRSGESQAGLAHPPRKQSLLALREKLLQGEA